MRLRVGGLHLTRVWKVSNERTFEDQRSVKAVTGADAEREVSGGCTTHPPPPPLPVTRFAFAQGAEHAAAVARAVADDNARAATVLVSGATGGWAGAINGWFAPTQEKGLDGRVVYGKCGDGSMCIEHCTGDWQVKPVSNKGKDACYAYVTGGCSLEACTSRVWRVGNGKTFEDQASVKAVTGADAEREVSGGCTTHHPPLSPSL